MIRFNRAIAKRRINLRLIIAIGVVFLFFLFIFNLTQFSNVEYTNRQELLLKKLREQQLLQEREQIDSIESNIQKNGLRKSILNRKFIYNHPFQSKPDDLNDEDYDNDIEFIDSMRNMQRLVHLDLKGAPPKLNYLKELIPFMKKAGATGVLIEYEDFFPYKNELESIRNQNHYTNQELLQIFNLLSENKLSLIPLIQTYGHLEFVLKLKQFANLRENAKHYQVITPCSNETYEKVLFRLIDQILEVHPQSLDYIHIGCDEVYHINANPDCEIHYPKLKTVQDFFIFHVNKLVDYIKAKRPNIKVMIWDDMIRHNMIDKELTNKLKEFTKRVVPVVWNYRKQVEISVETFKRYDQLFDELWIASAFKGATSQLELIPDTELHYSNHISWLRIMRKFPSPHKIKGIALTGWSRYDHMQAVCELMPAGLPSLVLCLQTWITFDQDESIAFSKTKELTKCTYDSPSGFIQNVDNERVIVDNIKQLYDCEFPGSHLYKWLLFLRINLKNFNYENGLLSKILNKYNMKNKYFNSMIYKRALSYYPKAKLLLKAIWDSGEVEFDKYFYGDLYEELIQVYLTPSLELIEEKIVELNKTSLPEFAPVRPFNKIDQSFV